MTSFEDMERTAREAIARISSSPLLFDADFENGSLDRVVRLGMDWYHIILRQDTWYRFFFRIKGCRDREVIFEFTCRNINNSNYDEGKGRWIKSGDIVKPLFSYDRKRWQPVDHIEKHFQDPGKYRFSHRFTEDEAYVSYHHPYTYSDMLDWLKLFKNEPRVTIGTLGTTRNGFPQPVLSITDAPSAGDMVVLIAREDADEITGSWGIEGVVRALLAPESRDLLKRYTFKIVPMVGIDGVVAGAHHSAGYG
ncbi:MAG: M14-type cytosolic carboxypeptidase, partial [Elusimicrobiota bacterium]